MIKPELKDKTKSGLLWTAINTFATSGLQFVVGVIMARLLSPSDYGITAIPVVFIAIADLFINGGFSAAMIRKHELSESDLSTAFIYSSIVGIVCYIIIFFTAPLIAAFYNTPVLTPLIRVISLNFIWTPLLTPQNILLTRKLDFKTQTKISIGTRVIGSSIGIVMAYRGYGVWALVLSSVCSGFISFIITLIVVRWIPKTGWSKDSFQYLWNFGNKMMGANLIDIIYCNLSPLIIGKYYSTTDLGVYNRADNYALYPSRQGTSILQRVTFPVLCKMQGDDIALSYNYRRMLKVSAFVIFPIMTLLAALAKPFIIILVTEKWSGSIILLQLLCFSSMWFPIHAINLNLLQVKGRSDLYLKIEIWKKAIGLTIMACTLPLGIVYFVAASILNSLITLFINTYYTGKLINVGFAQQMKDILPFFVSSLFIFVVVMIVNTFIDNLWIQLFVGGSIGAILYFSIALLFRFEELNDVKYMLKVSK